MVLTCAEQTTYRHSHVGSAGSPTVIVSGGDTNIKGAQVTGKGITVRATNFNIESLQDTADYRSRQQNISAQVTVGYGASASGDYSQSKINAEHRSVSEQSGLFAGDDGFDVQVGGHTRLTGGIITSGQSAEDEGKNRFQTATLTHSDIQNYSRYEGESFGLGANVAVSGKTLGQSAQNKPQDKHLTSVADKNGASSSVGYGSDGDSKNSTTRSGINTRNIHITDKAGQLARTGRTTKETEARIHTGIDTETADQHSGRLKNSFDKDAVAKEINLQREVTQEFGKNAEQTTAAVSDKLGNTQSYERYQAAKTLLEAELQNTDSETEKAAIRATLGQVNAYLAENQSRYDTWKEGGIGRSMLHGAAGGLTTGNLGGILAGGGTSLAAMNFILSSIVWIIRIYLKSFLPPNYSDWVKIKFKQFSYLKFIYGYATENQDINIDSTLELGELKQDDEILDYGGTLELIGGRYDLPTGFSIYIVCREIELEFLDQESFN